MKRYCALFVFLLGPVAGHAQNSQKSGSGTVQTNPSAKTATSGESRSVDVRHLMQNPETETPQTNSGSFPVALTCTDPTGETFRKGDQPFDECLANARQRNADAYKPDKLPKSDGKKNGAVGVGTAKRR